MARNCDNDPNSAEYILINGEVRSDLCSVCLAENLLNLVTSSESVMFSTTLNRDLMEARTKQIVTVL